MLPELKGRLGRAQQRGEIVAVLGLISLVARIVGGTGARAHHGDQFGRGVACPELVELPLGGEGFQYGVVGVGQSRCLVK